MATGLRLFIVVMLRGTSLMMIAAFVIRSVAARRRDLQALFKAAFGRAFADSKHTNRA